MSMSEENRLALPAVSHPALAMTPEELSELDEVSARPLIIRFDGRDGKFKNIDTEETMDSMTGACLGVSFSQVWFPSDSEAEAWPKWICRAENVQRTPVLHPELTAAQRSEALARGAGRSCSECPLRAFGDGRPTCTGSINLLWADSRLGEVATVQAPGTSITAMKHFLNWFKRKRISVLAHQVTLAGEKQQRGTRNWATMQAKMGPENTPEDVIKLRQLREEHLAGMTEHVRRAADISVPAPAEEQAYAAPTPTPDPAPAPRGRGLNLVPAAPEQPVRQGLADALEESGLLSGTEQNNGKKAWAF